MPNHVHLIAVPAKTDAMALPSAEHMPILPAISTWSQTLRPRLAVTLFFVPAG
jgi:hypothetical protein